MVANLVAFVTGGASGLGLVTVERLVDKGARVVLVDLPTSNGAEIAKSLGGNVLFTPANVTSEEDVASSLKAAKDKFGRLDVVVNCAGISKLSPLYNSKTSEPHKLDDFINIVMVNTVGTFNVARLAVGLMRENEPNECGQRGVIINTSSIYAYEGVGDVVAYATSKAAIVGMTLPMARDLGGQGIRVVAIAPGAFDTPILKNVPQDARSVFSKSIPFPQRFGKPAEFAHLVQCIIENPYLNGETIRLDGALRMPHPI